MKTIILPDTLVRQFLWLFLVLVTTACQYTTKTSSAQLMTAEERMADNPNCAMSLIDSIPDEILERNIILKLHNEECMTVVRFYKAASALNCNRPSEAQYWIESVIKNDPIEKNLKLALEVYGKLSVLDYLSSVADTIRMASEKDLIITELLETRSLINHYDELKQPYVERRLLNSSWYYPLFFLIIILISIFFLFQYIKKKNMSILRYQSELQYLNRQTQQIKDAKADQFGIGRQIYEKVMSGGDMKNISIEHEQYFVNYYAFQFPQKYSALQSLYPRISLRHTTYLILKDMGMDDSEIRRILFVKSSTIRNYRLRISRAKNKL